MQNHRSEARPSQRLPVSIELAKRSANLLAQKRQHVLAEAAAVTGSPRINRHSQRLLKQSHRREEQEALCSTTSLSPAAQVRKVRSRGSLSDSPQQLTTSTGIPYSSLNFQMQARPEELPHSTADCGLLKTERLHKHETDKLQECSPTSDLSKPRQPQAVESAAPSRRLYGDLQKIKKICLTKEVVPAPPRDAGSLSPTFLRLGYASGCNEPALLVKAKRLVNYPISK